MNTIENILIEKLNYQYDRKIIENLLNSDNVDPYFLLDKICKNEDDENFYIFMEKIKIIDNDKILLILNSKLKYEFFNLDLNDIELDANFIIDYLYSKNSYILKRFLFTLTNHYSFDKYKSLITFCKYNEKLFYAFWDKDFLNKDNGLLIRTACKKGNKKIIKFLLSKGEDINVMDSYCLRKSTELNDTTLCEFLIKNNADVTAKNNEALINSVINNNIYIFKLLIEKIENINEDCVKIAGEKGFIEILKILDIKNQNLRCQNDYALRFACINEHDEVCKFLIKKGCNNEYALKILLQNNKKELIKDLIGYNINYYKNNKLAKYIVDLYKMYEFFIVFNIKNPIYDNNVIISCIKYDLYSYINNLDFDLSNNNNEIFISSMLLEKYDISREIFMKINDKNKLYNDFLIQSCFLNKKTTKRFEEFLKFENKKNNILKNFSKFFW